jgi:hypothetical protein
MLFLPGRTRHVGTGPSHGRNRIDQAATILVGSECPDFDGVNDHSSGLDDTRLENPRGTFGHAPAGYNHYNGLSSQITNSIDIVDDRRAGHQL